MKNCYPLHVKEYVLKNVRTSYAWNWRSDLVADFERHGFVKIEHGGSRWSLTDKGQDALSDVIPQSKPQEGGK